MEFRAIAINSAIFKKCRKENLNIIFPVRNKNREIIPENAELMSYENGKIEFSYGEKTFFKHKKTIVIEGCFPDRSNFIIKQAHKIGNTKMVFFNHAEREIEEISIMRLSEATKNKPFLCVGLANTKSNDSVWVYLLTLKSIPQ